MFPFPGVPSFKLTVLHLSLCKHLAQSWFFQGLCHAGGRGGLLCYLKPEDAPASEQETTQRIVPMHTGALQTEQLAAQHSEPNKPHPGCGLCNFSGTGSWAASAVWTGPQASHGLSSPEHEVPLNFNWLLSQPSHIRS